ncbi:MAG: alpha/beta hydrolase [Leptospiraceae bacterium]|nr:alpha/beta hydrolase [Leptospiraceae bacterium]
MEEFEGKVRTNGINIYARFLPKGDKTPVVLVMGLAFQMTTWPENLIELLQQNGYPVLLFDNRDIGLSEIIQEKHNDLLLLSLLQYRFGFPLPHSYSLHDMAIDTLGLLDHFNLEKVHLLGISMGGMISQIMAASYGQRVKTLTLLSTSDNSTDNPIPSIEMLWRFMGSGVVGNDLASAQKRGLLLARTIQSPGFPKKTDEQILAKIEKNYYRSYQPAGVNRQIHAVLSTGSLRKFHPKIQAPTMIVHGKSDPLIRPHAGKRLSQSIPNSQLHLFEGLSHDLPEEFMPILVRLFLEHTQEQ